MNRAVTDKPSPSDTVPAPSFLACISARHPEKGLLPAGVVRFNTISFEQEGKKMPPMLSRRSNRPWNPHHFALSFSVLTALMLAGASASYAGERPATVDEWIEHVDTWARSRALEDWDKALIEFTVSDLDVHQPDASRWPLYTEVSASEISALSGSIESDAAFKTNATAMDHPHHGVVFGGIDRADLWLQRGDRVIAFVARFPESSYPPGAPTPSSAHLWEIRNVLQVIGQDVRLVTEVSPNTDLEGASATVSVSKLEGIVSRASYAPNAKYAQFRQSIVAKASSWAVER